MSVSNFRLESSEPALRLEELRREVQKGIDSGPATPLDMEAIKRKGRQRLTVQCAKANAGNME